MIGINGHTCITDDGGTPGRRCEACEAEGPRRVLNPDGSVKAVIGLPVKRYLPEADCPLCEAAPVDVAAVRRDAYARVFAAMRYDDLTRTWTGTEVAFAAANIPTPTKG